MKSEKILWLWGLLAVLGIALAVGTYWFIAWVVVRVMQHFGII